MTTILATGNKRSQVPAGFTLIELSLVVMILALVMALAAPSFVRSFRSALLGESARNFATTCQLARLQAVSQQINSTLHLDLEQQVYWLSQLSTNLTGDTPEPMTIKWVELDPRVRIASATLADGTTGSGAGQIVEINFYPNGTCDGGEVIFRSHDESDAITMLLDPITARATVQLPTQP
ncbi:MAG: prepilin-type N-terminal cleavage/methylation domain-containing protein [Verrucomicrobia bacterium]|nr:prepilin-type N-terminal cleavage/methylation domain-containing protein [Verrucomicrobiota bacterium]